MRLLNKDEIECRVGRVTSKGCSLLLYKTARVDRAILDEEFGPMNWQNDFKVIDGKMYGGIGLKNGTEWVWKWDCGTESNTEAEKGQASDCFKRAGFKWGIGVELYTAPFIWINVPTKVVSGKYKLENEYEKFTVQEIEYDQNRNISKLIIVNSKTEVLYNKFSNTKNIKPKKFDDTDIYSGLQAVDTTENALKYYRKYQNKVNNADEFKKTYMKIYQELELKERGNKNANR